MKSFMNSNSKNHEFKFCEKFKKVKKKSSILEKDEIV